MFGIDLVMAFVAGLVWWEIIIFLVLIGGLGFSLYEESSIGFAVAFGLFLIINWTGTGALWTTITLSSLLYYFGVYLIAGIGWSFYKWRLFVKEKIAYYNDMNKNGNYTKSDIKEKILSSKSYDKIVYWIMLWPFSSIGYLINDFIYDTVRKIVAKLYAVYDRITDSLLSDSDFK